jgi:hypothetical protein
MASSGAILGKHWLMRLHPTSDLGKICQALWPPSVQEADIDGTEIDGQDLRVDGFQKASSPDPQSLFEKQPIGQAVLEIVGQLHWTCIEARKSCRFDAIFTAGADGFRRASQFAVPVLQPFPQHLKEFTTWNTIILNPWHTQQPPCYCQDAVLPDMCEVCYQFHTRIKRPWYIEYPQDLDAHPNGGLCEDCMHLDFNYLFGNWHGGLDSRTSVPIGSLRDLTKRQNYCALCRLLVRSLRTEYGKLVLDLEIDGFPLYGFATTVQRLSDSDVSLGISFEPMATISRRLFAPDPNCAVFQVLKQKTAGKDTPYFTEIQRLNIRGKPGTGRAASGSSVDFQLLKKWIGLCDVVRRRTVDEQWGEAAVLFPVVQLRLIDVQQRCVKLLDSNTKYLALSYVWGGVPAFRCTLENLEALETPGGLCFEDLPRTIRDAITLASGIGERYIWVDSLCIVQDDEMSKKTQIAAMGSIYRSALATIVAHHGETADAGLSGVTPHSPRIQHRERFQGLVVANRMVKRSSSVWTTRAWTYQEALFSRRLLELKEFQVEFRSEFGTFCEDTNEDEIQAQGACVPLIFAELEANVNFRAYAALVDEYSRRDLTFDSDSIDAFAGILSYLEPFFRGEFLFGLPITEMENALLWIPTREMQRRTHPETGKPIFPTWSWAGWHGKVEPYRERHIGVAIWIDAVTGERFGSDDLRDGVDLGFTGWKTSPNGQAYYEERDPGVFYLHPVARKEERPVRTLCIPGSELLMLEAQSALLFVNGETDPYHCRNGANPLTRDVAIYTLDGFVAGSLSFSTNSARQTVTPQIFEFIALSRSSLSSPLIDRQRTPRQLPGSALSPQRSGTQNISFYGPTLAPNKEPVSTSAMDAELASIMERTGAKYSLVTVGESSPVKKVGPPPYYARDRRRQRAIQTPAVVHEATDGGDGDLSMLSATISARYAQRAAQILVREPRSEDDQVIDIMQPFDPTEFDASAPWCLYDVLLVEWVDGVAYRGGIGVCHVDAFRGGHPVTRRVILG